jgi:hypothetical protein
MEVAAQASYIDCLKKPLMVVAFVPGHIADKKHKSFSNAAMEQQILDFSKALAEKNQRLTDFLTKTTRCIILNAHIFTSLAFFSKLQEVIQKKLNMDQKGTIGHAQIS